MTSVYTAGPDGRCTVCQRPEAEHAPQAWTADARACPPVAGCPDLDPTWPGPDGMPRGPVRCTSFPSCSCGERQLADNDDTGACPPAEVTAETVPDVIDSQIRALRASVCDAANGPHGDSATAAHRVWHDCNRALGESGYERDDQARVRVATVINARAKGGSR